MADKQLNPITIPELSSSPSNPGAGFQKIYAKTDSKIYVKTSAGVETELGNVAGGVTDGDKGDIVISGGGTIWDIDTSVVDNTNLASGVGGIYKGSGTIAAGTVSTLTNTFSIRYATGGTDALQITESLNSAILQSKDATQYFWADNTSVLIGSGTTYMEYIDGVLRLWDSDLTQYVGIQPPATGTLTTSYTLTLPADDGAPSQVLTTNGSGVLSWSSPSGGLADADYGDIVVSGTGTVMTIDTGVVTNAKLASGTGGIYKGSGTIAPATVSTLTSASSFSINYNSGSFAFKVDENTATTQIYGNTVNSGIDINSGSLSININTVGDTNGSRITLSPFGTIDLTSNSITIANHSSQSTAAELRLREPSGSGTNYTAFKAQAQAANLTYTLPASIVTNGYLQTDASGNLSWATITAGGDVTGQASSVDSEISLFSGTTGKVIKRATGTGIVQVTSGVYGTPLAAPSGTIVGTTDTQTLTNKRIDSRVTEVTSSTSVTIDVSTTDIHIQTALAGAVTYNNPTGTPVQGQKLILRIKDNGTARGINYGTQFRSMGVTLPTTTVISKTLYIGLIFNSTDTTWDCIAVTQQA